MPSLPSPSYLSPLTSYRNGFDLHLHAFGQAADGDSRAGGPVTAEGLGIDLVHGAEVSHVGEEDGGFHHPVEAAPGRLQNGPEVLHHSRSLLRDPTGDYVAGRRVDRDLARRKDEAAGDDALAVGTDSLGGAGRGHELHVRRVLRWCRRDAPGSLRRRVSWTDRAWS